MNTEAEINLLRERVRELEKTIEKVEKSPLVAKPWWWRAVQGLGWGVIAVGASYGVVATLGPILFGSGPAVRTYSVTTKKLDLRDTSTESNYRGSITGYDSTIHLQSEEGEVRISPSGIRIEGPDGVLILKPEKK